MTHARKSTAYALLGFGLIAAVVLGGMAWATSATIKLEMVYQERREETEHGNRQRKALWQLDSLLLSVTLYEARRPYHDYNSFSQPAQIWGPEGDQLEPGTVTVPSPLLDGSAYHPWIELYFQVDPSGSWSSPELPESESVPEAASDLWVPEAQRMAAVRAKLNKLSETISVAELQRRLGSAHAFDEYARNPEEPTEYGLRNLQHRGAQERALPPEECNPTDLVARSIGDPTLVERQSGEDTAVEVGTTMSLWLNAAREEDARLAFVRPMLVDSEPYYQGFIVEWCKLKPWLLRRLRDTLPEADLRPVPDCTQVSAETRERMMSTIHAQLVVPPPGESSLAAAWRSVRPTLLVTWAAALVVLVGAGLGIRNLLALTERRLQFAYAVTHELRTPLTTFRLYSDMLSANLVPEESRQDYLDTLNTESQRLTNLVEGVLEYARVENRMVRLNRSSLKGGELVQRLAEAFTDSCKSTGVELRIENQMPPARILHTDPDLLQQIVGVLVTNACRYARRRDDGQVLLRLGGDNGQLELDVIDSGPGIDPQDSRSIFKPFHRGQRTATTGVGGIGLGLALARSWADLLGGRLELVACRHAQLGGAHFRVTIPDHVAR